MTDNFTSVMRALVVATLLSATATVMLVTVSRANAAAALAIGAYGAYGAYGDAYDIQTPRLGAESERLGNSCRVVAVIGCGARVCRCV